MGRDIYDQNDENDQGGYSYCHSLYTWYVILFTFHTLFVHFSNTIVPQVRVSPSLFVFSYTPERLKNTCYFVLRYIYVPENVRVPQV